MHMFIYNIKFKQTFNRITAKRLNKLNFLLSIISSLANKHIPFQQTSFISHISVKEWGVTRVQAIKISQ
jgi:hypothetical protein